MRATKSQLAHRGALHAQAIAASEGVHPLVESILRGHAAAAVATSRAVQGAAPAESVRGDYRWPLVDAKSHPLTVERRTGPRSSRFADLEVS